MKLLNMAGGFWIGVLIGLVVLLGYLLWGVRNEK